MSQQRLPSSFGKSLKLNTKGYLQPGTGDTHYQCSDRDAYGQIEPSAANPETTHHLMAAKGVPGPGGLPYIPMGK